MSRRRSEPEKAYPAYIQWAAAGVILMRELAALSRVALPWSRRKVRQDRLIPLTYRQDGPGLEELPGSEKQKFWKELVAAADASPTEQIATAQPVRRLVRLFDGEIVELKLAHRQPQAEEASGKELTAFFRFEDSEGPIGFAAVEQHGAEALLHSVFLLSHRRGAGAGSDMVAQVMAAAAAMGIDRVWLLTGSAAPFFGKLGFESTVRRKLPRTIARSSTVRAAPDSATCMVIDLNVGDGIGQGELAGA